MFQCKENLTICCFLAHKFPFTHLSSLIRINESSVQLDIQNRKWLSWKLSGLWFKEAVQISTRHFGKVKVKCTLVQTLRLCTGRTAHRGSRGIALPFHDHGTRRGWGVSVTPWPLYTPGKDPVRIVQKAGWAPGPVWTGVETLSSTGIQSPYRPARSHSLYRLSYPAHH